MGDVAVPPVLASAIQGYCYSSFNAGWETLSAAAGLNFIAAEEFGRWVCPGGNAWVTDDLWRRLVEEYGPEAGAAAAPRDARRRRAAPGDGRFLVTSKEPDGSYRSLAARRVVMACSKHICKYVLHGLAGSTPSAATRCTRSSRRPTSSRTCCSTGRSRPTATTRSCWPTATCRWSPARPSERAADRRRARQLRRAGAGRNGVLTLYWPRPTRARPCSTARRRRVRDALEHVVPHLGASCIARRRARTCAVRMTRWGHAMPVARAGFIAMAGRGAAQPFLDVVFFVNQDNWALPAFETACSRPSPPQRGWWPGCSAGARLGARPPPAHRHPGSARRVTSAVMPRRH